MSLGQPQHDGEYVESGGGPGDEADPPDAVADGAEAPAGEDEEAVEGEERQAKAPWHFKLVVVGSVIYLGYRLYQGISWLAHHV